MWKMVANWLQTMETHRDHESAKHDSNKFSFKLSPSVFGINAFSTTNIWKRVTKRLQTMDTRRIAMWEA